MEKKQTHVIRPTHRRKTNSDSELIYVDKLSYKEEQGNGMNFHETILSILDSKTIDEEMSELRKQYESQANPYKRIRPNSLEFKTSYVKLSNEKKNEILSKHKFESDERAKTYEHILGIVKQIEDDDNVRQSTEAGDRGYNSLIKCFVEEARMADIDEERINNFVRDIFDKVEVEPFWKENINISVDELLEVRNVCTDSVEEFIIDKLFKNNFDIQQLVSSFVEQVMNIQAYDIVLAEIENDEELKDRVRLYINNDKTSITKNFVFKILNFGENVEYDNLKTCVNYFVEDIINHCNENVEELHFKNISKSFCDQVLTQCEEILLNENLRNIVTNFIDRILIEPKFRNKEISNEFYEKIFNFCVVNMIQSCNKHSPRIQDRINLKNLSLNFIDSVFAVVEHNNERKEMHNIIKKFIDTILKPKYIKHENERNTPLKPSNGKKGRKTNNFDMPLKILDSLKTKEFDTEQSQPKSENNKVAKKDSKMFIKSLSPLKNNNNLPLDISPKFNSINKINIYQGSNKYINDYEDRNADTEYITFYSIKDTKEEKIVYEQPKRVKCAPPIRREEKSHDTINTSRDYKDVEDKSEINYPCVRKTLYKNMSDVNIKHGLDNEIFSEDEALRTNSKVMFINIVLQTRY